MDGRGARGAFQLPARVKRDRGMDDVFMYVVEIRNGDDYRASTIEHMDRPEAQADQQIKDVYAAVDRVLNDDQVLKP
ncbi:MAG TPA: hypothetical protein VGH98_19530 [Gemmatimonadaceae bacterium]